jgi:opacity protein-like surface antigen
VPALSGTTQNGVENNASNSGGVLGSYRYFFSEHHGIEANYGYALNTQSYSSPAGATGVKAYAHEVSGAYVLRLPRRSFTPFALGGVGALVFDPKGFAGASTQTRAAFVYGAGADFNFSQHVFLRAEYRASFTTLRLSICRSWRAWIASRTAPSRPWASGTGSNGMSAWPWPAPPARVVANGSLT